MLVVGRPCGMTGAALGLVNWDMCLLHLFRGSFRLILAEIASKLFSNTISLWLSETPFAPSQPRTI